MASPFPHPASPPTPDEALPSPRPSTARATQLLLLQRGTTGTCVYPFFVFISLTNPNCTQISGAFEGPGIALMKYYVI